MPVAAFTSLAVFSAGTSVGDGDVDVLRNGNRVSMSQYHG